MKVVYFTKDTQDCDTKCERKVEIPLLFTTFRTKIYRNLGNS